MNYMYLADAQEHYSILEYKWIDVPWFVSTGADNITRPSNRAPVVSRLGHSVGSGEQSFIDMMLNDKLDTGKFMCITPCVRDEYEDKLHCTQFMKLELISTYMSTSPQLDDMVQHAHDFFKDYIDCRIIRTFDSMCVNNKGYDIVTTSGIELGSYGIRRHGKLCWTFGTGVAEPRLSTAIRIENGK